MGFHIDISDSAGAAVVTLAIALTRQESTQLFVAGDAMIAWPDEGLLVDGDPVLARTSIFASEVAARREGLVLSYQTREQAERTAQLLQIQLSRLGLAKEG